MRKHLVLVLSVFLFLFFGQTVYVFAADQPKMTLEEIEHLIDSSPNKEVKAYFMSVPRGTEPKRYDIILRGVYKEPGFKVIVFVMSRHIAAGMSGSPAYVNGKLLGAVAYGFNNFNFSSYAWGGISPISLMVEEAGQGSQNSEMTRSFNYRGMLFEPIAVGDREIPGLESVSGGKFILTTSSAVTTTASKAAKPILKAGRQKRASLKAGIPIVVDLIEWTDEKGETTTVSAMGTITYVDDDGKVFAFGHPFLNGRKVVYSFRTAEVMGTLDSEFYSFKLKGKSSEVLGAIMFDATYGISGTTSLENLSKLHTFTLEFREEGKYIRHFNVKVADSVMTPLLAQTAFKMIGRLYGAPLPQEVSATQFETKVELKGYKPIIWQELFISRSIKFGLSTLFMSSYDAAYEAFFSGIYSLLFNNQYGLEISNVSVVANFIPGQRQTLKLVDYRFPNKVVWGEDPVLEILFVSEDNSIAIAKEIRVKIDWSKVEKPVYKKDTLETDKEYEKIVGGVIQINSARYLSALTVSERKSPYPEYFLGTEDFLENFSRQLEATNQKIYGRVILKPKSGLFDETIARAEEIIPPEVTDIDSGWYMIKGGLTKRKEIVRNENAVFFNIDFPPVPSGYVINPDLNENIRFEVILEN